MCRIRPSSRPGRCGEGEMNSMLKKCVLTTPIIFLSTFLVDCSTRIDEKPPDAIIASGSYDRVQPDFVEIADETAPGVIHAMIDRDQEKVIFELEYGSQISASLDLVSRTWGQGCPTTSYATSMEIISLEEEQLTLDGVTFEQPVLVATCPSSKNIVVLREYGSGFDDILPGAACDWWAGAKCIYFGKE